MVNHRYSIHRYVGLPVLQFLHTASLYHDLFKGSSLLERLRKNIVGRLTSKTYSTTGRGANHNDIIFKFSCLSIQCCGRSKSVSVCTFKITTFVNLTILDLLSHF